MAFLNFLNNIFVKLQRWKQGIPAGPAHFYNWLAIHMLKETYRYILEEIEKEKIDEILEVGHGPGKLLINLAKTKRYSLLAGIDISKAMGHIAQKNFIQEKVYDSVNSVVADAHKLPFRKNLFDLIISNGTLHHIRTPEIFFKECIEILANRGEAWIYEFSYDINDDKLSISSRKLKTSKHILKIIAALHGLPRKEYREGYIREALKKIKDNYMIIYDGIITKLILSK